IKWRGRATKASLRSRRSRGARDTIFFYIGVRSFRDTEKNPYRYFSSVIFGLLVCFMS
ncbi:hypothetical protein TSAR_007986, partial [Trichomalopsis sarcophagae]